MVNSYHGALVYRRSLCFLLAIAVRKLFPSRRLVIGHSLGNGYYYHFDGYATTDPADLGALEETMRELVRQDLPIQRRVISYQEALVQFQTEQHTDTALLLNYRNESKVATYVCSDFTDLAHLPLVPSTGILKYFEIRSYPPGFLLRFPRSNDPYQVPELQDNPVIFGIYQEYKAWGKILNVNCVGRLNELFAQGRADHFVRVAETLHEKKIANIADRIQERRDDIRVVLVAGPSSSGKTTFTKKLAIQLQVVGFNPSIISLDDYFVPREETPRDEDGNYDFEALEAIDIQLLNEHLLRLFDGDEIEVPSFDFRTGQRREDGKKLALSQGGILLMEGIHGLNDQLTPRVPRERKYKIYVSALTQVNLDDHNRIPTTDNRLLRRMVRDHQFRGHSAMDTLEMWPSVRKGENTHIFPFQNSADSAFNSALDYELAVLKVYAEPLLKTVKPYHRVYTEAVRLLSFLNNFAPLPARHVPPSSILREFIGDSAFEY